MKRKELVWQGFGILTLLFCFFYLTRSVIFSVEEEYGLYYIVQKGDFFLWLNDIAHETGRITFYVLCWFWAGPMFLGPVAYKICLCIFVGLDLLVFFRLLYVHVNRQFAFFCTALLIPLLQINDQHNLLITYAYLHVPFILILLSIHFLIDYGKGKKGYSAVLWSALCNFVASFFQENFVLFYVSCFLILFFYEKEKHFFKRCLHALWELRFHVLGGIVFLAAYFLFRASCAGSSYSGNTPNFSQPLNSLIVLFTFLTGLFPGTTFYHLRNALPDLNLLAFIDWKNVVIILISTIFVCYLLYKMPRFSMPIPLAFLFIINAVLACLLHSFSQQYLDWVIHGDTYAYVPSFYAYIFLSVPPTLLLVYLYSRVRKKLRPFFIGIFALLYATFSILVAASNRYYTWIYHEHYEHYSNYEELFQTLNYEEFDPEAQILVTDPDPLVLLNNVQQCMTTVHYNAFFFQFTRNIGEINAEKGYYILSYENNEASIQYVSPASS